MSTSREFFALSSLAVFGFYGIGIFNEPVYGSDFSSFLMNSFVIDKYFFVEI